MATTINADTSTGGAIVTGDASGVLGLQAAGSTQVTISTSGVVLANPLPVASGGTGATSLSGLTTGTATNIAGGSNGTIPYQSASGTTAMLAAGTSGYVLQSNGVAAPSWVTPATGAMALLATVNATSGTYVTFSGYFTSAYDVYLVTGSNFFVDNVTVAAYIRAQIAIASTYQTAGNYRYSLTSTGSDNTVPSTYAGTTSTDIVMNARTDLYRGNAFSFYIYNPLTTNESKSLAWTLLGRDGSNNLTQNIGVGSFTGSSAALTGIRFFWDGGTFQSGKFQLYGLKNS